MDDPLHDPRPQQQSLQKELSSFEAHMSHDHTSFQDHHVNQRGKTAQRQLLSRPSGQPGQICVFQQQSELHQQ